jgi:hypothetical protein
MIPSPGILTVYVGWSDLARFYRIRCRIDGPGEMDKTGASVYFSQLSVLTREVPEVIHSFRAHTLGTSNGHLD